MKSSRPGPGACQGVSRRGGMPGGVPPRRLFSFSAIPINQPDQSARSTRSNRVDTSRSVAHQIAQAASAFEQQRTGLFPSAVTVVLSAETLVVTLHGALSPAERTAAKTPAGAAQVRE